MERSNKLLSVIVPVYNVEAYLTACVQSLREQTYAPIEILLVDDGSTDGSGEICDQFAERDARVRVFHRKNGGLSAARNTGLDAAKGDWIGFLDGDDTVTPMFYGKLIDAAERNEADIASGTFNYIFPDREIPLGTSGKETVYTRREALELLPLEREIRFEVCPKVFSRGVIGEIRFLPGQIYEDVRFTRLTFPGIERFVYVDDAGYRYLQKRAGSTNTRFPREKLDTVHEVDRFCEDLQHMGLPLAAERMRAFCLEFLIRLTVNARACHAGKDTQRKLIAMYRARWRKERKNPSVRKGRAALFAASPALYDMLSQVLHKRA